MCIYRNKVWRLLPHTPAYVWSLDENCNTKSSALTRTAGEQYLFISMCTLFLSRLSVCLNVHVVCAVQSRSVFVNVLLLISRGVILATLTENPVGFYSGWVNADASGPVLAAMRRKTECFIPPVVWTYLQD